MRTIAKRRRRRLPTADADDEEGDATESVKQLGNRVYFYADVTVASVQALYERLDEANKHALLCAPVQVHLHLHSNGGDAYAGLAAYYHLQNNPVDLVTHADGYVASAATFMLLAGKTRVAAAHSFVLIHQVSAGFFGKYNEMQDELGNTDDLMRACRTLYASKTKMTNERIDELFRSERASDAVTCLSDGIVHSVA